MQSVNIKLITVNTVNQKDEVSVLYKEVGAGPCKCYVIGTDAFKKNIQKKNFQKTFGWKCFFNCATESDVLNIENIHFPKGVKETSKKTPRHSFFTNEEARITQMRQNGISDEDIAGVLLAVDELNDMKIFPATKENIYAAFLKLVESYIADKETAKKATDEYLQTTSTSF